MRMTQPWNTTCKPKKWFPEKKLAVAVYSTANAWEVPTFDHESIIDDNTWLGWKILVIHKIATPCKSQQSFLWCRYMTIIIGLESLMQLPRNAWRRVTKKKRERSYPESPRAVQSCDSSNRETRPYTWHKMRPHPALRRFQRAFLAKASRIDGPTDRWTNGSTDGHTLL